MEDEVDNQQGKFRRKTDQVIDKTKSNLEMLNAQGDILNSIDKKNENLRNKANLAAKTIT